MWQGTVSPMQSVSLGMVSTIQNFISTIRTNRIMTDSSEDIAERATELQQLAISDPSQVPLDDLREIISTATVAPSTHGAAIIALLNVARDRDDVGSAFVDDLDLLLNRPSLNDTLVLRCLRQIAMNDPTAVLKIQDEITERISLDDSESTQAATGCCVELASTNPQAFVDLTPMLSALLDVKNETIRTNAMYILSQIAHEYPEEVKPLVPQFVEGITERDQSYQTNALSALGAVTSAYPAAAKSTTEVLSELTTATALKVRANATALLADIAKEHPEAVEDHVPALIDCFHSDDEFLCGNAASAVLHVGVHNPAAVEQSIPALIELLDDPSPIVRRNACRALGQLDATAAIVQLQSVAESDSDEKVRELASWAVDEIS